MSDLFSAEHRRQFIGGMLAELRHAYRKHGARPWSKHEFYAVLLEEVDEAWDAIKSDKPIEEVLKEIMQVACVCLRYAETPDAYKGAHSLPLPCRIHMQEAVELYQREAAVRVLRPRVEWFEDDGIVLWWQDEAWESHASPYMGTPLDLDFPSDVRWWSPCPDFEPMVKEATGGAA